SNTPRSSHCPPWKPIVRQTQPRKPAHFSTGAGCSGFNRSRQRERPVVDGQHRLLEAAPSALLAVVCSAVVPTGAQR
ncbi:MAG: hypothetical protein AB7G47_18185, partial [Mycolicibacterium sp.]